MFFAFQHGGNGICQVFNWFIHNVRRKAGYACDGFAVSRAILLCVGYGLFSLFATWFPRGGVTIFDPCTIEVAPS